MARMLYGIVDCAADERIYYELGRASRYECLYAGPVGPALAKAAPYLVEFEEGEDNAFYKFWMAEGLGKAWGIMCASNVSFEALRRHFRHFLRVKIPDGRIVEFRFYDPRTFRVYLPSCNREELSQWFAGVEEYRFEDEGKLTRVREADLRNPVAGRAE